MEPIQPLTDGHAAVAPLATDEVWPKQIDATALMGLRFLVQRALRRALKEGRFFPGAALRDVFVQLFGPARTLEEQRLFLLLSAPLARRVVLERAAQTDPLGINDLTEHLNELESANPLYTRILDLHYFAGLDRSDIALTLGVTPEVVIRHLRLARAWLQLKARRSAQRRAGAAQAHELDYLQRMEHPHAG